MFAVYETATGRLVSAGSKVAEPLPAGLTVVDLSSVEADGLRSGSLRWDPSLPGLVAAPARSRTAEDWTRDLVGYYRAVPASVNSKADNTTVLQRALDDLVAGEYAVLVTPPGVFRHGGVSLALPADGSIGAHLVGAGRRLSKWQCMNAAATNLAVSAPSGNARDLTVTGMTFTSGARAVTLSRASYNLFRNCTFEHADMWAVELLAASNANTFESCWWVHNQGESLNVSNGQARLVGCQIGEDTGHIQNNGALVMVGCLAHSSASKLEAATGGPRGMGRCLIYNTGNGALTVSGCNLSSNFNLVDMRFSDRVSITGSRLSAKGVVFMMDDAHANGSGVLCVGNNITLDDGAAFYGHHDASDVLTGSIIKDNIVELNGPNHDQMLFDGLDASNIVADNVIRRRS